MFLFLFLKKAFEYLALKHKILNLYLTLIRVPKRGKRQNEIRFDKICLIHFPSTYNTHTHTTMYVSASRKGGVSERVQPRPAPLRLSRPYLPSSPPPRARPASAGMLRGSSPPLASHFSAAASKNASIAGFLNAAGLTGRMLGCPSVGEGGRARSRLCVEAGRYAR